MHAGMRGGKGRGIKGRHGRWLRGQLGAVNQMGAEEGCRNKRGQGARVNAGGEALWGAGRRGKRAWRRGKGEDRVACKARSAGMGVGGALR